jgi:tubulin---tyrosine ligase
MVLQPLPNAFELFGVDFLVTHESSSSSCGDALALRVNLLEINAEPAIELTGPRLTWILEDLFLGIGKVCVAPFVMNGLEEAATTLWTVGETRYGLRKCLQMEAIGYH